jgi:hypothetical protein
MKFSVTQKEVKKFRPFAECQLNKAIEMEVPLSAITKNSGDNHRMRNLRKIIMWKRITLALQ